MIKSNFCSLGHTLKDSNFLYYYVGACFKP